MRDRKEILIDLIAFRKPLPEIKQELKALPWDVQTHVVVLDKDHFMQVLEKSDVGTISFGELEEWANLIECREDIAFANPLLEQYLVELANPMIYELISEDLVQKILSDLNGHSGS
jgi:hypothetical protein